MEVTLEGGCPCQKEGTDHRFSSCDWMVPFLGDTLATGDLLGFKNESDYKGVNYAYSTFNTNTSTHHAVYQLPNGKAHS